MFFFAKDRGQMKFMNYPRMTGNFKSNKLRDYFTQYQTHASADLYANR